MRLACHETSVSTLLQLGIGDGIDGLCRKLLLCRCFRFFGAVCVNLDAILLLSASGISHVTQCCCTLLAMTGLDFRDGVLHWSPAGWPFSRLLDLLVTNAAHTYVFIKSVCGKYANKETRMSSWNMGAGRGCKRVHLHPWNLKMMTSDAVI